MSRPQIKFLTPDNLHEEIKKFTVGMAVTRDHFEMIIPRCTMLDMEWNHMDQMHRPHIHKTYSKGIRIALGKDFAVSMTQWKNWPLFITVTDSYVAEHLFYQSMTIAGMIFLHSVISLEDVGNNNIKLKNEWFIGTHKFLRFLHKPLNKKLYHLNERLQAEDAQIRHHRFELRNLGYTFRSDPPNFYNSNRREPNTIYPTIVNNTFLSVIDFSDEPKQIAVGGVEFIIKKENANFHIWPAACPHEGGPLLNGKFCNTQITCPWHGLRFSAAMLSEDVPCTSKYGFEYNLIDNKIYIQQLQITEKTVTSASLIKST